MNKRMKAAVVGLSFGGWVIENELLKEGSKYFEIDSVCDLNEEKAKSWGERLGVPYYTDMDRLLDERQIGACVLITGPVGRAKQIDKCIDRGIHVMTTKPFELTATEAERVLKRAREKGIVVQMNSPSPRPASYMKAILDYQKRFDLGRPIAYRAADWCSYREKPDGLWYDDSERCPVAPIFRLGIYMINEVASLMGDVEKVSVAESRIFTGRPTSDNALVSVLHKNGVVGSIFASFCVNDLQHYKCSYEINYERGTIYKAVKPRNSETSGNKVSMQVVYTKDGRQYMHEEEIEDSSNYQWEVFYHCIGGAAYDDLVSDEQIVAGIRLIEMMKKEKMI